MNGLIRSISGLKEVGGEIASTRGSLRIQRYEYGQIKFSFVGKAETIEFFLGLPELIQVALGETLLVTGPGCTLVMSRTARAVDMQVQRQETKPVEFEMPLEKFGELVTSIAEERFVAPPTEPAVYLN